MNVVDTLKQKCEQLLIESTNNGDVKNAQVLSSIKNILGEDDSLKKMDAEIVVNILSDLGYSVYEIPEVYASILKNN